MNLSVRQCVAELELVIENFLSDGLLKNVVVNETFLLDRLLPNMVVSENFLLDCLLQS